jgi:hypothetical protein
MKREQPLWRFAAKNLPDSLRAFKQKSDYGEVYGITIDTNFPKRHLLDFFRNECVAQVEHHEITLFKPQYFSDMQNLAEAYEKLTGQSVTLKLWEKP